MRMCIESSLSRKILIFNILAIFTLFILMLESDLLLSDILGVFMVITILISVTLLSVVLKRCDIA